MLQTIETHMTRTLAERARFALVQAQQLVDAAWLAVTGSPVEPSPEDTYTVHFQDGTWVVAMFNPYAENVEVSSTDERNVYDCGD